MARIPASILRVFVPGATLAEALPRLRETYCGPIAYEVEHIGSHSQRLWLREAIETRRYRVPLSDEEQKQLLKRLTEVDALERFMHKAYLGQKQFSVEGLDMTVPMIDEVTQLAGSAGAREVVIGMAHRGRLNVLAHNLGRSYGSIFAEFEGSSTLEPITTIPQGGTGDVKYHHGAQGSYQLSNGESIVVRLESNPSHLEFVGPVASGATRAAQTSRQGAHAHQNTNAAIPCSCTATPHSPARASSPRRSTCRRWTATPSAARSTSSRTTRSGSRPIRRTRAPRPGRPTWRRDSTSRSSTSTRTTWRRASRRCGWRSRSARSSATTF